ncbi:MAG: hypothetical protein GEV07_16675 [Streptosporangiales bacterium]|nr:hypothetical protein [Streptosporangiales bacterium]
MTNATRKEVVPVPKPHDPALLVLVRSLCHEVDRLRARLKVNRTEYANLLAAARASLGAQEDNEPDPLFYLRDELANLRDMP